MAQAEITVLDDDVERIGRHLARRLGDRAAARQGRGADTVFDVGFIGAAPARERRAGRGVSAAAAVLPVRLAHAVVLLGPVASPGGPCPTCLERRWTALRPMAERRALEEEAETYVHGRNPRLTLFALEAIWQVAETMLARREAGEVGAGFGEVYVLSLESHQVVKHLLAPDSLCPACADRQPDSPESAVLELRPRPKRGVKSYRVNDPGELALPERAFVNPVCGVLGAIESSDYQHMLTAPVSGRFHIRGTRGEHPFWWSGHADNYRESLRVGILEGLERHAGIIPRKKTLTVFDSYENLRGVALDPAECGFYPADVYRSHSHFFPFSPDLRFSWVWGYSLTERRPILVPEQLVYYADHAVDEPHFVQECSNGCAAGGCLEEAILFGLLELIERDGFLISWYASLSLPRIDPWSCRRPETLFMLDRIERMNCDIHLLDMRLDLPVPSVMAFTKRRDAELGSFVLAAGSSLDPDKAIHAALCEVASYVSDFQRRVAVEEPRVRAMMEDYRKVEKLGDHALLYGLPEMAARLDFLTASPVLRSVEETYREWDEDGPRHADLLADLEYCIGLLAGVGLKQVIAVDQTSPEQERLGLKTASVIVPGLIPIDFGHGRERASALRRMQTVPRAAGFRESDWTAAELNPLPHPFP
jgi:ribosomal protein S12 methylthiotransferase accessory factor